MKSEQAQIMSVTQHPSVKSINDIKLTIHTKCYIPKQNGDIFITRCIVCPNGKMIFMDYYSRLVILNDDGTLYKEISCLSGHPYGVSCLDNITVTVSTYNDIKIINIESTKTVRRIKTGSPWFGITHHNGVLLWCEPERAIQMIKLSDDKVTTLVNQINLPYYSYITTCGHKIYQANRDTNIVTCYTKKGVKLWEHIATCGDRLKSG